MINFRITLEGTAPLLMHNSRLANPLDPIVKEMKKIHGKQRKTEDDYWALARLEHAGGLYMDPGVGPYLPSDNVWRSLYDAAKKHKMGPKIKEAILFPEEVNPLAYQGPRTVDALWADENFRYIKSAKVQASRVMRCRPIFREWRTEATGILDTGVLDFDNLKLIAETASLLVGMGDWRPRFGRYIATVDKV